ncbi:unnamed protein product [Aphanomyces euteiches]
MTSKESPSSDKGELQSPKTPLNKSAKDKTTRGSSSKKKSTPKTPVGHSEVQTPLDEITRRQIEKALRREGWKYLETSSGGAYCKPHVELDTATGALSGVNGEDYFDSLPAFENHVRRTPALMELIRRELDSGHLNDPRQEILTPEPVKPKKRLSYSGVVTTAHKDDDKPVIALSDIRFGEIDDILIGRGWQCIDGPLGFVYCKPHVVVSGRGKKFSGKEGEDYFYGRDDLEAYVRADEELLKSIRDELVESLVAEETVSKPKPPRKSLDKSKPSEKPKAADAAKKVETIKDKSKTTAKVNSSTDNVKPSKKATTRKIKQSKADDKDSPDVQFIKKRGAATHPIDLSSPSKKSRESIEQVDVHAISLNQMEEALLENGWKVARGSFGTVFCKPHVNVGSRGKSFSGVEGEDYFRGEEQFERYVRGDDSIMRVIQAHLGIETSDKEQKTSDNDSVYKENSPHKRNAQNDVEDDEKPSDLQTKKDSTEEEKPSSSRCTIQ